MIGGLVALSMIGGSARAAPPAISPRLDIYIQLIRPSDDLKASLQDWRTSLNYDLTIYLGQLKPIYPYATKITIQPPKIEYLDSLPTLDKLQKVQKQGDILQIASMLVSGTSKNATIRNFVYLGDLKGPLARDSISYQQKISADDYSQATSTLIYLSTYAVAQDAARTGQGKAACALLSRALERGQHLDLQKLQMQDVQAVIQASLRARPCV